MRPLGSKTSLAAGALLLAASIAVRLGAQAAPAAPAGQGAGADAQAGRGGRGAGRGAAGGVGANGQSFPAQQRAAADPATIERGKTLYGVNCNSCHGSDLRGGDMGGPNLLRSDTVLADQHGELIIPIVRGSRQQNGMDPINLGDGDIVAIAEYIHSVAATMRGQGNPPLAPVAPINIVVGDAAAGQVYFAAKCATCHSVTGDLKGIASRMGDPMTLQNTWVAGSAGGGGRGGGRGAGGGGTPVTVTVTPSGGPKVEGRLDRIDDFIVVLTDANGLSRSFRRDGDVPKVEIHNPLDAHLKLLPTYTDKDIHDVTAYLVTLK